MTPRGTGVPLTPVSSGTTVQDATPDTLTPRAPITTNSHIFQAMGKARKGAGGRTTD